jgi:hypothetical protein
MNAQLNPPTGPTLDPFEADVLVVRVMTAVRATTQDRSWSVRILRSAIASLGAVGATVAIISLLVVNAPGPSLGSAGQGNRGIVVASEPPFAEPYLEDSGWTTGEASFLPGLPDRYATLDEALGMLRSFFLAGLHAPRGEEGVTIIVPDGADQATEAHLFVILHGGANPMEVGEQFRVIARHDARGWWIDPYIEARIFCEVPFGGEIRPGVPDRICD